MQAAAGSTASGGGGRAAAPGSGLEIPWHVGQPLIQNHIRHLLRVIRGRAGSLLGRADGLPAQQPGDVSLAHSANAQAQRLQHSPRLHVQGAQA
jgi:hypothetical protein